MSKHVSEKEDPEKRFSPDRQRKGLSNLMLSRQFHRSSVRIDDRNLYRSPRIGKANAAAEEEIAKQNASESPEEV